MLKKYANAHVVAIMKFERSFTAFYLHPGYPKVMENFVKESAVHDLERRTITTGKKSV